MAYVIIDEFVKDHIVELDKPFEGTMGGEILNFNKIIETYYSWQFKNYNRQKLNTLIKRKTIRQYFHEKYGDPSEGYTNIILVNDDLYYEPVEGSDGE